MSAALARIAAIAVNSFREAIRNKVLYGILAFAVVLILVAMAIGVMSLHEEARVARDVSVAGVSIFGGITALYLGVSMLYNEIQKKTIHTILAKPLERYEFVLGKYLGMVITLTIMTALFTLALAAQLAIQGAAFTPALAKALVMAYAEVLVVAAIATFFSSFSSPFLSGIFAALIWVLGRVGDLIVQATQDRFAAFRVLARVALWLIPDLHVFSVSGSELDGQHVSVHTTFVTWGYVAHALAYAAAWIAVLLVLAALIFRRRDFL